MKRTTAAVRARVHRVWMPIIESIFKGCQAPELALAEARIIEAQFLKRNTHYHAQRGELQPVSMPLFELEN